MNNAIGAGNQKNFLLFLAYTLIASLYFYVLLVQFLLHEDTNNEQSSVVAKPLLTMTRVLIFVLVFTILFTASMALNQIYGIRSGFGTIDRMKMGAQEVARLASPIPFSHVFGTFGIRWFLPLPPMHKHPEDVFRYTVKSYRFGRVV